MFPQTSNEIKETGNNAGSINNPKGENTMEHENENHTESSIIEGLKKLDTTPSKTNPGEIPAGSYLSTITHMEKTNHPDGKYDIVKMEITIQGGQHSGFVLTKCYHQKTKKAVSFFKREMEEVGITVNDRYQLDLLCDTIAGTNVVAEVTPSDSGNQAVYLKNANTKKTVTPVDPDSLW